MLTYNVQMYYIQKRAMMKEMIKEGIIIPSPTQYVKTESRRTDIDILKGIGIILVLIGHSFPQGILVNIIYSFHMPLFFIVAGYFFKKKPVLDLLSKDFKRLLVPYYFIILLILIGSIIYEIAGMVTIKTKDAIQMLYNHDVGAIWFIAALFWARQIFNLMLQLTNNKYFLLFTSFVLMIAVIVINKYVVSLSYYTFFFQGITGVVFVSIGYIAKEYNLINIIKSTLGKITLGIITILWLLSCHDKLMGMLTFEYNNYIILDVIYASFATYMCYVVSYYISKSKYRYFSSFLTFMGVYSLVILCWGPIKYHFLPLKSIPLVANLTAKVLWLVLTIYLTIKIPFLRKIFQIKK